MARSRRAFARTARRRRVGAIQTLGAGTFLVLLPGFLGASPVGQSMAMLRPLGWLLLLAGAALLLLQRRTAEGPSPALKRAEDRERSSGVPGQLTAPRPAMNRVATQAERSSPRIVTAEPAEPVRPTQWGPEVFARIEWRRFEAVIEALFAQAGFNTRSQSHGADGGVDVWLQVASNPGTPIGIVQCKHWLGKRVGVDKVRELRGVMASHGLHRGHFATTSSFTPEAKVFATQNGIHLLDIEAILQLIQTRSEDDQQALLRVATDGEYWRPTCVNCGTKLVARAARDGSKRFWGCSAYPRCRTTMPMRAT